jgi:hypothetical protein
VKNHPIRHSNGSTDSRYSLTLEHTGHARPHWVARFCGEWIASSRFYSAALARLVGDASIRKGNPIIEEIKP